MVLADGHWRPRKGVLVWVSDYSPRRRRVARCGTDSGYYRHLRRTKTKPCAACKSAHSQAVWRRFLARQERERKAVA
jgi:hypothetical protein